MQDNKAQETTQKTIRIDNDLIKDIEELGKKSERDFSSQIRFMLKEYLRIREIR